MNLLQIRTEFVKLSGRYDLVVDPTSYVDNGANSYINEGIHFLERLVEVPEASARLFFPVAAGEYSITFQHKCRVIREVWVNNSEERFKIEKLTLNEMKEYFADAVGDLEVGEPVYFAPSSLRALETTSRDSLATFLDKTWDETDTNYDYRGILLAPPSDENYVVEIEGLFKQANLSTDADENYWTIEEPGLTIRAALYKLECRTRGASNVKQWLDSIRLDVVEIDKDIVTEQIYEVNEIDG
jgi:hypothetical protein